MERPKTKNQETYLPSDTDLIRQGMLLDKQTFDQVYKRDQEALQILRCTNKELADLVRDVYRDRSNQQKNQFLHHTPFQKDILVEAIVSRSLVRGLKSCPWKESERPNLKDNPSNVDFRLTYNNKTIVVCGLLAHLIEDHGFYEGCPPYRVAPEEIVEFLGTEKLPGSIDRAKKLPL
jgi:hypothetical protein